MDGFVSRHRDEGVEVSGGFVRVTFVAQVCFHEKGAQSDKALNIPVDLCIIGWTCRLPEQIHLRRLGLV